MATRAFQAVLTCSAIGPGLQHRRRQVHAGGQFRVAVLGHLLAVHQDVVLPGLEARDLQAILVEFLQDRRPLEDALGLGGKEGQGLVEPLELHARRH